MARYPAQIDVSEVGVGRRIALPERADFMSVYNPTAYTLLCGWGSQRIPVGAADADFPFPPAAFTVLPVTSAEFGLVLTEPQLVTQPPGMPTRASVVFYARETPPLLSSIPLTGLVTSTPTTLYTSPVQATGTYTATFDVPAGVTELWLVRGPNGLLSYFDFVSLSGVTSNQESLLAYPAFDSAAGLSERIYVGPWLPNLDTQCQAFYQFSVANGTFRIMGVYGSPSYSRNADGAAMVMLDRGSRAGLVDSSGNPITTANPLPTRAQFDRTVRVLLPQTAQVGAGTILHGPYDMQGASGGLFVVYASAGAGNITVAFSPDGANSYESAAIGPFAVPAYVSVDFGPGATGAGGVTLRQATALKGSETVVVTRTAGMTYGIFFYPSTFY